MTEPTSPGPLRLRAITKDDLDVIAALLQDALLPMMDVAFQPKENRFLAVANRFRWENPPGLRERILCALQFEQVRGVRVRGVDRTDRGKILNLLSLIVKDGPEGQRITLVFAGGGEIELTIGGIDLTIEDRGEPWPALSTPNHDEPPTP